MAYFAELDDNNEVLRVIAVADENEENGEEWCHNLLGGMWKQTSYNARIRGKYASIGDTYDPVKDVFIGKEMHKPTVEEIQNMDSVPANEEIIEITRKMGITQ